MLVRELLQTNATTATGVPAHKTRQNTFPCCKIATLEVFLRHAQPPSELGYPVMIRLLGGAVAILGGPCPRRDHGSEGSRLRAAGFAPANRPA